MKEEWDWDPIYNLDGKGKWNLFMRFYSYYCLHNFLCDPDFAEVLKVKITTSSLILPTCCENQSKL